MKNPFAVFIVVALIAGAAYFFYFRPKSEKPPTKKTAPNDMEEPDFSGVDFTVWNADHSSAAIANYLAENRKPIQI